MKLLYRELKMPCSTQEWSRIPPYGQGNPTLEPTLFFFFPSLHPSLCWIEKTPYTIGGEGEQAGKSLSFHTPLIQRVLLGRPKANIPLCYCNAARAAITRATSATRVPPNPQKAALSPPCVLASLM